MTDLRSQAIDTLWFYCGGSSEDALDALLSFLADHADEWSGAAMRRHPFGKGPVSTPLTVLEHAIAVLSDTGDT